jgi:hypothetical protein
LQQFAAVSLPLPSTVFQADGIFLGNAMEISGKQNPESGFKSPPSTWIKSIPVISGLYLDTYDKASFYVKNVIH